MTDRNIRFEDIGDMALMRDISAGNIEAYSALLDRYLPLISRTTFRMLCDRRDSEYVTISVFINLWNDCTLYDDRFSLEEWLLRMTYRLARRRLIGRIFGKHPDLFAVSRPKVENTDDYITTQAWELFCRASMKMSPVQRAVFTLTSLECLSDGKTSFIYGISVRRSIFAKKRAELRIKEELACFGKEDEYDAYVGFIRKVSDGLTDICLIKRRIIVLIKSH